MSTQHTPIKPVHGAPKPINVPNDMISTPPVECAFKVGDRVVFTNDAGIRFDKTVRGFASAVHGRDRFVYLDLDCWWFPVEPSSLAAKAVVNESLTTGAAS